MLFVLFLNKAYLEVLKVVSVKDTVDIAAGDLLSRDNYLVTQANDLAKSLGNLTAFQQKILDFCFSFVQESDKPGKVYSVETTDILRYLQLNLSGFNYTRVAKAFKSLNEGTAIYMLSTASDGSPSILMTTLFDYINVAKSGTIDFSFGQKVAPYVFQLKKNFYSFHLRDLSAVKSKYTMTMLRRWNATAYTESVWDPNNLPATVIKGTLQEWESWFLGSDNDGKPKKWPAGRFLGNALKPAIKELERLFPSVSFHLTVVRKKRKVIGYEFAIRPLHTNVPLKN